MHTDKRTAEAVELAASAEKMKQAGNYARAAIGYTAAARRLVQSHDATLERLGLGEPADRRKAKHDIDVIARWLRLARRCVALTVPTSGNNRPTGVISGKEA